MALSDNLISYWSLDEASGSALDAHGSNDLAENGGSIASTTGKVGNCRDIEASSSQYFGIADNTDLSTGDIDFTIAAWAQLESTGTNRAIVGKFATGQQEYRLFFNSGTNRLRLVVTPNGSTATSVEWSANASTATWYFVVAWHDSVNNQLGISVNDGTPVTQAYSSGVFDGTSAFAIGGRGGSAADLWDGLVDEVGFWKRVLSAAEITELYNSGNGRDYAYITGGGGGSKPWLANRTHTQTILAGAL